MLTHVESRSDAMAAELPWTRVWRTAVTRPSVAEYRALIQTAPAGTRKAWAGLFGVALFSGALASARSVFMNSPSPPDAGLAAAIPLFAILALAVWALFAGFTHAAARCLHGRGAYGTSIHLLAAYTVPLMTLLSVVWLVLPSQAVYIGIHLYWFLLTVVATQAVHGLSRVQAFLSVAVALLLSSILLIGVVAGVGLWMVAAGA